MLSIIDEFDCHTIETCQSRDKGKDITFMQKVGPRNHGNVGRDQRAIECFNCHKKGHVKADCWAKEGGRTKVRDCKGRGPRRVRSQVVSLLNIAKDEDRVLMAAMDDSSNADNEGELVGYFGEEDNEDPKMCLTLILISKLMDTEFHSHFASSCRIFNGRDKVIGDVPQRNRLYQVDHSMETGERLEEWQPKS